MNLQRCTKFFALAASAAAVTANAQVVNGSFEQNGNYSTAINGWTSYGNKAAFTANTAVFDDPTDGTYQAHISSNTDGGDGEPDGNGLPLVYSATGAYAAEDFLGVNHGDLTAASGTLGVGGTGMAVASKLFRIGAIEQTVHLKAGDKITFDYEMLTSELYKSGDGTFSDGNYRPTADSNDFSFFTVSGGGVKSVTKLLDTFYGFAEHDPSSQTGFDTGYHETRYVSDSDQDIYLMETGYLTYSFTAAVEADYTLGFGVTDAFTGNAQGTSGIPSGLSIDNVRYTAAPVPEPASFAALGLGAIATMRRRKRA